MNNDFKEWVLDKAANIPSSEMVEDDFFVSRLLTDILWGRSKRFNRTKKNGISAGLNGLQKEYDKEIEEMALLICPKCKGSLTVIRDPKTKGVHYVCPLCGSKYDTRPK